MSRLPPRLDPLDVPLLKLSENDYFGMKDATEGTVIFGRSGGGKTTGPGAALRRALLRTGAGFCAFMAKPGDTDDWLEEIREEGRIDDVCVFGPGQKFRLNALSYMYRSPGNRGGTMTDNVLAALSGLLAAKDGGDRGKGSDPFWFDSSRMLLGACIDLIGLAGDEVSFEAIHNVIADAPESMEQVRSTEWQQGYLNGLVNKSTARTDLSPAQRNDLGAAIEFFLHDFPRVELKTRSGIISTVSSMSYSFRRGLLAELFGPGGVQISPEQIFDGKIVLVDLSFIEFLETGRLAMILWATLFMRATERRDRARYPKPVVLWADEFQNCITSYSSVFASTARSANCITVYLSQNIDTLRSRLSGPTADSELESLLANLAFKCFACNDHEKTNTWASKLIGEAWQTRSNVSANLGNDGGVSASTNEQRRFLLEPTELTRLKCGGVVNSRIVETIVYRSGRTFAAGENYLRVSFRQKRRPNVQKEK